MIDVGPAPFPTVPGLLVAGSSHAEAPSILREGMRTHPLGYAHFPTRPFFSARAFTCGFGRRTSKRGVHTGYAHGTYPSGAPESASNRAHETGAAPHCAAPPRLYFGITRVSALYVGQPAIRRLDPLRSFYQRPKPINESETLASALARSYRVSVARKAGPNPATRSLFIGLASSAGRFVGSDD